MLNFWLLFSQCLFRPCELSIYVAVLPSLCRINILPSWITSFGQIGRRRVFTELKSFPERDVKWWWRHHIDQWIYKFTTEWGKQRVNIVIFSLTTSVWIYCESIFILCDKDCQWLMTCRLFSTVTPISSTNKTDSHDITEIMLQMALNTIALTIAHLWRHMTLFGKRVCKQIWVSM
jgi:hypothetical protein